MTPKKVFLAVALLAAASGLAYLATRPGSPAPADARVGAFLVAPETVSKAACIRLSDTSGDVTLRRGEDGAWVVAEYHGFPADFRKLTQLMDSLLGAKVDRFVTASAERLARYELKGRSVVLEDASGAELWSLTLGKTTETGARLLSFGDEKKAFQSQLSLWLDVQPKSWAEPTLTRFSAEEVARIEFATPGSQPLVLSRSKKEDSFAAEGGAKERKVRADKVNTLISTLGSLRFSETTAKDDGKAAEAAAHYRRATFTLFDGTSISIDHGRKPELKVPKAPKPDSPEGAPATGEATDTSSKAAEPAFDTVPAGPVFVSIRSSDSTAVINALMQKRAFQVADYAFSSLPSSAEELLEPLASPAPVVPPASAPAPQAPAIPPMLARPAAQPGQ